MLTFRVRGAPFPPPQGVTTLGTIYSSSLFPGRAPAGHMLLLNYIGGATNRGIVNQSQEDIVKQVGAWVYLSWVLGRCGYSTDSVAKATRARRAS